MRILFFILLLISLNAAGQSINSTQQKALNSVADFANQSTDDITSVFSGLKEYYSRLHQKNYAYAFRYVCPVQLDEYYYNAMLGQVKNMPPSVAATVLAEAKKLRVIAEKIDVQCKALDTYHKLEDYKQDNYAKADVIILSQQELLTEYHQQVQVVQSVLRNSWKKLMLTENPYRKADQTMFNEIERDRNWLDNCIYNLNESVHSGWAVDKLEANISAVDATLKTMPANTPTLKYPASSMWGSFKEGVATILESKRSALNGYNNEAKKSDRHSNEVYLSLINYFNGVLVADYNTFIQFAQGDAYYGIKALKYVPKFAIKTEAKQHALVVSPFKDTEAAPISIAPQKIIIPSTVYQSLTNYVEFINETWRQTNYLQAVTGNFSSSAAYYKTLVSFERRGAMHFDYKDFELPLAEYQKAVSDSKMLPLGASKTLNTEAEVLLNILKEMNDQCSLLELEVSEKRYEKDHLDKIYQILERLKELFLVWDDRKEKLYDDVRKIYDAYVLPPKTKSWYVSGNALYELSRLGHAALFQAKNHYRGKTVISISTEALDLKVREVIANEYEYMKGIQKIGRYNGLCPYTPYEDLPEASKYLSELVQKLDPVNNATRYNHPYYKMMYQYNLVVDHYNKFCELSKEVLLLKTVKQPEWFELHYPKPTAETSAEAERPNTTAKVETQPKPETLKTETTTAQPKQEIKTRGSHDHTIEHDTVVIVKRDTVYIREPNEELRSMEGYAVNNMILLLDVSGSMNTPDKLPVLKKSVLNLLGMMRTEDEVGIVVFSDKPKVLLVPVSFKDEDKIKSAIDKLKSSGKTDGNTALKLAYKVADENYIRGGNNRIVLATDGEFAVSEETRKLIESFASQDIFLTIFNFGKGMGASKSLEQLTVLGKGNYVSISKENVEMKLIHEVKAKRKR